MAEVKAEPRTRDRIDVAPRFTQADVIRLNNLFRGQDAGEAVASVIGAGYSATLRSCRASAPKARCCSIS